MAILPFYVDVDFKIRIKQDVPIMTQHDTDTVLIVRVSDKGDMSPEILDEFTNITLASRRPDGSVVHTLGTRIPDTTEVQFELTNGELNAFGFIEASLQFYTIEPERVSTLKFKYEVERDLSDEFTLSEGDSVFLQELLADTRRVVTEMETSIAEIETSLSEIDTTIANGPVTSVNGKTGAVEDIAEKAELDDVIAQLEEKVDSVVLNGDNLNFLSKGRQLFSVSIVEAGNTGAVQSYIDNLVSNGQIEGVTLADRAVTSEKLSQDLQDTLIYPISNVIVNGDFRNGTTNWSTSQSVLTVSGNTLTSTGNGATTSPGTFQLTNAPIAVGKKFFVKTQVRALNPDATFIRARIGGTVVANLSTAWFIATPIANQWYDANFIAEITNQEGNLRLGIDHLYSTSAVSNGKKIEVKYVTAIDLTDVYGAGNEPTLAEVNTLISDFPNSWFDGTENLFNSREVIVKQKEIESMLGINNYSTIPVFINDKLTKVEELDGSTMKKETALTYNDDGTIKTVTEKIEGKTIISTMVYANGKFSHITKQLIGGGL